MFQLLLQYLLGDDDDVQRERKENSKSQFLFAKTRSGAINFTIENGEKERKKERNATHRELLGRCRANVDARRRRHDER